MRWPSRGFPGLAFTTLVLDAFPSSLTWIFRNYLFSRPLRYLPVNLAGLLFYFFSLSLLAVVSNETENGVFLFVGRQNPKSFVILFEAPLLSSLIKMFDSCTTTLLCQKFCRRFRFQEVFFFLKKTFRGFPVCMILSSFNLPEQLGLCSHNPPPAQLEFRTSPEAKTKAFPTFLEALSFRKIFYTVTLGTLWILVWVVCDLCFCTEGSGGYSELPPLLPN